MNINYTTSGNTLLPMITDATYERSVGTNTKWNRGISEMARAIVASVAASTIYDVIKHFWHAAKDLFKCLFMFLFAMLLAIPDTSAQRTRYSGSRHNTSHGGHYRGGSGSSHKGGHYTNRRTGNHYGRHKR